MNIPNALTISRLAAIPVLMALLLLRFPGHDQVAAALTAPWSASKPGGTPSWSRFTESLYATIPPRKYSELPDWSVNADPSRPPVQDSATETVSRCSLSAVPTSRTRRRRGECPPGELSPIPRTYRNRSR